MPLLARIRIPAVACLAVLALQSNSAFSQELPGGGLPVRELLKAVKAKAITTRKQLLRALSPAARRSFTMVVESQGPDKECVTEEFPRAIVFSPADDLDLIFNGNPAPGCQDIELVRIVDRGGRARSAAIPYRITVDIDGNITGLVEDPNSDSVPSDRRCKTCHGEDWIPVWSPYSVWPGVEGEFDDFVIPESLEDRRRVWMSDSSPYSDLDWSGVEANPSYPYRGFSDEGKIGYARRPNLRLTNHLSGDFASSRAARLLEESPVYQRRKWRLFADPAPFATPSRKQSWIWTGWRRADRRARRLPTGPLSTRAWAMPRSSPSLSGW
jgi:hypothetical protein